MWKTSNHTQYGQYEPNDVKKKKGVCELTCIYMYIDVQLSLDFRGGMGPTTPHIPKSVDAHVPFMKWHSICL